ncbi:MAG: hypothetical protein JST16_08300 [Bdellovibrionales bacterium]|nr:hypothetical protein [Bdellovibrionales bacterium]
MITLTQTQKRFIEWPLILVLVFGIQIVETAVELPLLGPVHVMPVLITYLAVTRNWGQLTFLTLIFSFMASSTVGYPWPTYVAVQVWTALALKAILTTFTLEGRREFTGLTALGNLISKAIVYVLLSGGSDRGFPLSFLLKDIFTTTLLTALLAWFIFPLLAAWDAFFEHEAEEARELKPGALR